MEVKVMSMQGTHIFMRDQMTQLIRCVPWTPNLCLHLNMIKKMKTLLEVENKMGPIIPALANQYRPSLPEMNPNVRKGDATEKRKRVAPKRRFRPASPKATAIHVPLPQAPPKPTSNAATAPTPTTVRQGTPWPSTGKMSDNLFQDRNWLLPKGYLAAEGEKEEWQSPAQKKKTKQENKIPRKNSVVGGLTALYARHKRKKPILPINRNQWKANNNRKPLSKLQVTRPDTLNMTKTKQQWERLEMERLNEKYNLNCSSDSELDSESDEDEQYQYQHWYKMLI